MSRLRAALTPYALIFPGGLWLAIFFVVPMIVMLSLSLQSGSVEDGYAFTFNWHSYADGLANYHDQIIRSLLYGLASTALQIAIGFPVAYWIAFKGGSRKSVYLFLLLLPFLVSFVLRTISWQFLLSDNGILLGPLKDIGLLPDGFRVLATPFAVIAGLAYNFLPFMVLPMYVALERIDPRVLEAAQDLYASRFQTFLRVVLPLSLPGVFAGVLMTFVPATSDYVNASVLGGTNTTMIGNVIQNQYLVTQDYPTASALSFTLMALLLVGIFVYARALGTEDVLEVAAR
ncbi:ABC transporter permease [Microbispora bryophytorum]|uniref:ABC transporter permease n=2 Tax=Microbispora bryophytorum TaxID=1460882 RepID=A0A8H9H6F5_9ACTN|nr:MULTISPECIES: ABC transporter permease [Microbispora]MBD3141143.1 ABC transporter permease [Microbispora bryophytorum]MBD3147962.1 ABC transporter permease [Microbispora camponoti]TQR99862.1 ABC transporter permease [Microbispora bryophytorum]GGO31640.1 ABC transporter permease [Microbispora bryophytorum]